MGTTIMPPELLARKHNALERANRVRAARAILMHRIELLSGRESCAMAADVIADVPEVLASLDAFRFVCKVRQVGDAGARRLLASARVPELTRLGDLTPRQGAALESALRYRSDGG